MLISKKLHETSTFLKKVANFHYKLSDFSTRSEKLCRFHDMVPHLLQSAENTTPKPEGRTFFPTCKKAAAAKMLSPCCDSFPYAYLLNID